MTVKNTSIVNWKKYYIGVVALLVAEIVAFYFHHASIRVNARTRLDCINNDPCGDCWIRCT